MRDGKRWQTEMSIYLVTMSRALGSAFIVAGIVVGSGLPLLAQEPTTVHSAGGFEIAVAGDLKGFALGFDVRRLEEGLDVVALKLTTPTPAPPPRSCRSPRGTSSTSPNGGV